MRSSRLLFRIIALGCILSSVLAACLAPSPIARASSPAAYFTSVLATDGNGKKQVLLGGTAKVYSGQAPVFEETVFFNNVTGFPSSTFYEVIFVTTGLTTISFTGGPVIVAYNSSGTFKWQESGGFSGSGVVRIRIELWLNSSGTPTFENAVQFDFLVVSLSVTGWSQSQVIVQRGLNAPVLLMLNFTNGGNDVMYNSSLALLNSSQTLIQPYAYSLGNIQAGQSNLRTFNVTASRGPALGPIQVLFRISFADFRGVSHAVNETAVIYLAQMGTQTAISLSASSITVNGYVSIKILVIDNNGDPVPGVSVTVNIGTLPPLSLQTDSVGNAVYQYQARNGSGVFVLRATYSGDATLAPSTGSSTLTIKPLGTALTLTVPTGGSLGQSSPLSATLLDETGHPVTGANITFLVNGVVVGWVLTDASGVAVLYYYLGLSGTLNFRAAYKGNEVYQGVVSSIATVNVAPASLLVIGGIDLTLPAFLAVAFGILILTARSLRSHLRTEGEIR